MRPTSFFFLTARQGAPVSKTYVGFPTSPVFGDPLTYTTVPGSGKNFDNTALAGKSDVLLTPGQMVSISTTFTVGTLSTPIRFKSQNPVIPTIVGDGTNTSFPCFRGSSAGQSRHTELYDVILYSNQGGVAWPGNSTEGNASSIRLQNVESHRHDFAGYWVNDENEYYDHVDSYFYRFFDLDGGSTSAIDGGEGLYIGHTSPNRTSKIWRSHHKHLYGWGSARDGVQLTTVSDMEVSNATIRNSGTWGPAGTGQNRLFQIHSSNGKVIDSIFDGGPAQFEVQSSDTVFYNCFFKWMNTDKPFIGGLNFNGDGAGDDNWNDKPIIFDSCIFKTLVTGGLLQIQVQACDVIVRNCIISDTASSLFHDTRANTGNNTLIDGGGNVFLPNASIPDPNYVIEPGFDLHLSYVNTAAMIADQASQSSGRRYQAGADYYTKKPVSTANISDYIITLPGYVIGDDYFYNRYIGYRTPKHPLQPTDISFNQVYVQEDQAINSVIGQLTALGGSGSYTYEVLDAGFKSSDYAAFNISGNNLRTNIVFDVETKSSYNVRIRARSATNTMRYTDKVFAITVVPVATVATDITLSSTNVNENVGNGVTIATISDNGTPGSIWTLVSGTGSTDNSAFTITGNALTINSSPDYETKNSYAIRLRSTNSVNNALTFEKQFTITVNDLLEGVTAEYTAILNEATSLGYTLPSAGQQTKQNQIILDLKNSGVWTKLDTLWVLVTDGSGSFSYINWKNPTGEKITLTGSPVFTSNVGWRSAGNSHYLNSNFNISTEAVNFTQDNCSWTIGLVAPNNGVGSYPFGVYTSSDAGVGFRRFNTNVVYTYLNNAVATSSNTFQNGDFAIFTANRTSSVGYTVYRNNVSIQSVTAASIALPSGNMPICAVRNEGGTIVGAMTTGAIKFLAMGAAITDAERGVLYNTMLNYCNSPS